MIADVVHTSLNARGGAERLSVVTVKALLAMGFKVQLATNDNPNLNLIQEAFGEGIVECLTNTGKQDLSEKNDGETSHYHNKYARRHVAIL